MFRNFPDYVAYSTVNYLFMKELEEIIEYLKDRYQINISTENYIRNKLTMRNPEKERIEAKLRLWDTPGFSQFLEDLNLHLDIINIHQASKEVKRMYKDQIAEFENKENKLEQGKLDL
jgi:hypothetical protein